MTITSYRAVEPLYIVTLRNNQAESMLRGWIKENKVEHASVSGNKMMLHEQRAFDKFCVTWVHSLTTVIIWDTWARRHIYLD